MALFGSKKNKKQTREVKASTADDVEKKNSTKKVAKKAKRPSHTKNTKNTKRVTKTKAKKDFARRTSVKATNPGRDLSAIVLQPRITEKAAIMASDLNTYVFNVNPSATKTEVKSAIEQIYKVSPVKISITRIPNKMVRVGGARRKTGVKGGGKKAYVYLKKGDKIDFV